MGKPLVKGGFLSYSGGRDCHSSFNKTFSPKGRGFGGQVTKDRHEAPIPHSVAIWHAPSS
jgi:hypothetical protein